MDKYINPEVSDIKEGVKMGKKVLIATLYSPEPVLLAATRLGPDKLILLIDEEPSAEQQKSFDLINNSLGKVIDVKPIKTSVYDIVKVAEKCVDIIDAQSRDDQIFINITSGRKTKAIGLLFAAYARHDKVAKIAYNPEEDKASVVYLPKLSLKLSETQGKVLDCIAKGSFANTNELADKLQISRAMVYRAIDELKDMDLIITEDGLKITDAGKIARL